MFEVKTEGLNDAATGLDDCAAGLRQLERRLNEVASKRVTSVKGYEVAASVMRRDAQIYGSAAKTCSAFAYAARSISVAYGTAEADILGTARPTLDSQGTGGSNGALPKGSKTSGTNTTKEADDKSRKATTTLLKFFGKFSDSDSDKSAVNTLADFMNYVDSLKHFFDTKNWEADGSKEFFSLFKDSTGLWKTLYDSYERMLDVGKIDGKGLFSANGKVFAGWVGFLSGGSGLLSTMSELVHGTYDSRGDFIGELISKYGSASAGMVKGVHEFQEAIEKGANLAKGVDIEASPGKLYSPAALWTTFAETIFATGGQAVKSWSKYYADGKWDIDDTAGLMCESAVSGLTTMFDSLLFGVPKKVFGLDADKISSGLENWAKDRGEELGKAALKGGWAWVFGGPRKSGSW